MLSRTAERTRRALAQPAIAELIGQCRVPAHGMDDLARALGTSVRQIGARLALLRRHNAAQRVTLHDPTRLGRPYQAVTFVALRHSCSRTRDAFERRCIADPEVTTAVQVTGLFDYILTTFHRDAGVARRWLQVLATVDGVTRVEQNAVEARFGHALHGVPVLWSQSANPKTRRHTVA